MNTKVVLFAVAALLACSLRIGSATAREDRTAERLLAAAEGLQMPSSESDSAWSFVSYPDEGELPDGSRFQDVSGCPVRPEGGTARLDFDATLDRLSQVEPWMDPGQERSARGFRKLALVFRHEFDEEVAVYRCETGGPEVYVYFMGADGKRLAGLVTISIET